MHTYTYAVTPVRGSAAPRALTIDGASLRLDAGAAAGGSLLAAMAADGAGGADGGAGGALDDADGSVHSWEVRLVLEFCDKGTLREALNRGVFRRPGGGVDLAGVLATALDVARAMVFLHDSRVVHADLKVRTCVRVCEGWGGRVCEGWGGRGVANEARVGGPLVSCWPCAAARCRSSDNALLETDRSTQHNAQTKTNQARNVLLKSTATDARGFTAKVSDFGLSVRVDPGATHVSNLFQGTMVSLSF